MALELTFIDPNTTPFMRWACALTEQLSSYNAPSPVSEGSWASWAADIAALPELVEVGVPTPSTFASWRAWANALSQVIW